MASVLTLREYERISCGSAWSAEARTITPAQHNRLERFSEAFRRRTGDPVFVNGPHRSLVAQNHVGVVDLGGTQIEILPKIDGDGETVRRNLIRMIAATVDLTLHPDEVSEMERTRSSILEVLIGLFCRRLWAEVRRGMVRRYETQADNLVVLRGRLNVSAHLRHNLARPDRLYCSFDEFTEDNALNRLLKAAARLLLTVTRSEAHTRSLSELLGIFDGASTIDSRAALEQSVSYDRLNERFRSLGAMARMFLVGRSPDVIAGKGDGFSLLFDMNVLFEEYVGRQFAKVFRPQGVAVSLQGPTRHLALNDQGRGAFELRPDIVMQRPGSRPVVIDTKWKRLKPERNREGVSSPDAYQLFAYAKRYGAESVVLLYPHHSGLGEWRPERAGYRLSAESESILGSRLSISTIDLSRLDLVKRRVAEIAAGALADHCNSPPGMR